MPPLDRFSGHADQYASYRIDYPSDLYQYLLSFVPARERAWDCATGNGQVAGVLADYFTRVDASDISGPQLEAAVRKPPITYHLCPAEQTPFPDQSFDLITVAQSLHWFDTDAFHREARRVARPGAVIAEWGYDLVRIGPVVDELVSYFYRQTVGPYWDPNRRLVDNRYATIPFPFSEVQHGEFWVRRSWDADRFLNYLRTWSSVQKYIRQHSNDPTTSFGEELKQIWGAGEKEVCFPVFLRLGKTD